MAYVITMLLLVAVVWLVTAPLRRDRHAAPADAERAEGAAWRIDLEAARDSKYREIRDAELDHETGKLSDEDYEAIDSTLRAEAVELLHQLDALVAAEEAEDAEDAEARS